MSREILSPSRRSVVRGVNQKIVKDRYVLVSLEQRTKQKIENCPSDFQRLVHQPKMQHFSLRCRHGNVRERRMRRKTRNTNNRVKQSLVYSIRPCAFAVVLPPQFHNGAKLVKHSDRFRITAGGRCQRRSGCSTVTGGEEEEEEEGRKDSFGNEPKVVSRARVSRGRSEKGVEPRFTPIIQSASLLFSRDQVVIKRTPITLPIQLYYYHTRLMAHP